jgi:predicted amidohydrolase
MTHFAVAQYRSIRREAEGNLERIAALLGEDAAQGVELAVFAEWALTGHFLSADEARSIAEPIPGPRTNRLVEAARQTGSMALVGTIEQASDASSTTAPFYWGRMESARSTARHI